MEKIKILMLSVDPMVSTGYGQISKRLIETFKQLPMIDLKMIAYYGAKFKTEYQGIEVLPSWGGYVGDASVIAQCKTWKPHLLLTTFDLFVCPVELFDAVKKEGVKIASLLMVDSSPFLYPNFKPLQYVDYPIVVTEQAINELPTNIAERARYIPLSLDKEYHIIEKQVARQNFNNIMEAEIVNQDTQLTSVVSANFGDEHGRKNFYGIIKGWKLHLEQTNCTNKYLYLHTDVRGLAGKGTDIKVLMLTLKYTAQQASTVIFPNQMRYLDNGFYVEDMNNIYSASDVYLNPSQGEGFGMPITESIACGCFPLVTDFGASRELIEKTQFNPEEHLLYGEELYVGNNAVRCHIAPQTIADTLTVVYSGKIIQEELAAIRCKEEYSYEAQIPKWEKLIQDLTGIS